MWRRAFFHTSSFSVVVVLILYNHHRTFFSLLVFHRRTLYAVNFSFFLLFFFLFLFHRRWIFTVLLFSSFFFFQVFPRGNVRIHLRFFQTERLKLLLPALCFRLLALFVLFQRVFQESSVALFRVFRHECIFLRFVVFRNLLGERNSRNGQSTV